MGLQNNLTNRFSLTGFKFKPDKRSDKIIFLSCEGCVTEECYFNIVKEIFKDIRTRICLVSTAEPILEVKSDDRTKEQNKMLSKTRPKQLLDRIEWFRKEYSDKYQFDMFNDEFWIVTDVDNNWKNDVINKATQETYRMEWDNTVDECKSKGYGLAVSNPCFEFWLLLHHDDPSGEDANFAVTMSQPYQGSVTGQYFRERLRILGVPLLDKKKLRSEHYNREKIESAVKRAESLHSERGEVAPQGLGSTVYKILKKIIEVYDTASSKNT